MGVEKLYESEDYLLVNKPYDMYINSDDENEKVNSCIYSYFSRIFIIFWGYVSVNKNWRLK